MADHPHPPFEEAPCAGEVFDPPAPDVVDLVLEASTMESVFAAQRLLRIHGMRCELLTEAEGRGAGVTDLVERSIRLELAAAMRITEAAAGRMITRADALVTRYPAALDGLGSGRMTLGHAEHLADTLDQLPPELCTEVLERAVALAEAEPMGTFRRALRTLIETVQASTLDERHQAAVQTRRAVIDRGHDGMSELILRAPDVELQAIHTRATAIAKTIHARDGETRTLDQIRADVICDLLIDGTTDHLPAAASGIRATVVVTVPALTLLDQTTTDDTTTDETTAAADPPVVEGVGPVPLSKARELCGGDTLWMRVLTHPETGIVLSVGRDTYRAPEPLRKLVRWRADRCMAPGCGIPASRCEIDHQTRWTDGGHTALDNSAPFCKGHHLVKDNTDWVVRQVPGGGGAIEWTSPTGRRYVVQPERKVPVFTTTPRADEPAPPF